MSNFANRGGRGRGRGGPPLQSSPGPRSPAGPGGSGQRAPYSQSQTPDFEVYSANTPPILPPHLLPSDTSHNQLIKSFSSVAHDPARPLRPGYGTLGIPGNVRANFFAMKLPKGPIYDYDVKIEPQASRRESGRLLEQLEKEKSFQPYVLSIAHDTSRRLVSAKRLPQPFSVPIKLQWEDEKQPRDKAKTYTVSLTLTGVLDPKDMANHIEGKVEARNYEVAPLVSALNLVLQRSASKNGARVGKNKYFFKDLPRFQLGGCLEAWQGYFVSVRPSFKRLLVNVNVCMSAFVRPGPLSEALFEFNKNSRGAMPTLPKDIIRSIKLKLTHLGYNKKLDSIGTKTPRNMTFQCEEFGGEISVESYFRKKYNITLLHASDLPVVNVGTKKDPRWVPPELCEILPGSLFLGKLDARATQQMIKVACRPPRTNGESIVQQGFPTLGLTSSFGTASANEFGIEVEKDMAVVPYRILPPPQLSYRAKQGTGLDNARINQASWNLLDVKFHQAAKVASWWIFPVRDGANALQGPQDPRLQSLVKGFAAKLANCGLAVPQGMPRLLKPAVLPNPQNDPQRVQAIAVIREILSQSVQEFGKPSFVLVLLENRDNYIYPAIKRIGDVELGINTIHMQLSKALEERKQDQYFSNVALKVNTKLGGLNHLLDANAMKWLTKKRTMLVGADVTHRGPGSREGTPSIAALVASYDNKFVQFPASLRLQTSARGSRPKEMIDDLETMFVERLQLFQKKSKALPERIILFRDGVSEGQFDAVLREELPLIFKSYQRFTNPNDPTKPYRPQLSIIICGKRHHAKLFATNSSEATKNGNTRPGTVVDKGITAVFDFDFHLQAHAGLQGHVKGTHYTVVYDESRISADEIQQGINHTSYLYARATKAVSLIPPAYYADLACERARMYLNNLFVDDASSATGSSGKLDREQEQEKVFQAALRAWGNGLHPSMEESMFYI
ncbi:argonaute-like protein [Pluteus cervinus]|uniref:Argonaute-like protein n=1 Tax=Pluteus cervinus TaxID=181527 RepID=A0ACD3APY0_9AGAR|nr:argonaute-like protein [Pluteus cervinus]